MNLHVQTSIIIFYIYLSLICNSIHTIRVICFDLFLYVWGSSYRKRSLVIQICYQILCRLNLMIIVPKTLMIKMDKVWLLMQVSLMIEIMRFFYIKREYDTSSKATQELRRLILRGNLEIHVCDCMIWWAYSCVNHEEVMTYHQKIWKLISNSEWVWQTFLGEKRFWSNN